MKNEMKLLEAIGMLEDSFLPEDFYGESGKFSEGVEKRKKKNAHRS